MGLTEYRKKRRFGVTPEPSGAEKPKAPKKRRKARLNPEVSAKHRPSAMAVTGRSTNGSDNSA